MRIGELAGAIGISPSAIRYYERAGLLRPPARTRGRRDYDAQALAHVALIRRGREAGLGIGELRSMIAAMDPQRRDARQALQYIADAKMADLDRRIDRDTALRARISELRDCGCENPRECLPLGA